VFCRRILTTLPITWIKKARWAVDDNNRALDQLWCDCRYGHSNGISTFSVLTIEKLGPRHGQRIFGST